MADHAAAPETVLELERRGEDIRLKPPHDAAQPSPPLPPAAEEDPMDAPPKRGCARCWGSRSLGALVATALVLALAICLLLGDSPRDAGDELTDAAADAPSEDDIQKGYIINAPARCEEGKRYFRGKCRKVF